MGLFLDFRDRDREQLILLPLSLSQTWWNRAVCLPPPPFFLLSVFLFAVLAAAACCCSAVCSYVIYVSVIMHVHGMLAVHYKHAWHA